MPDPVSQSGSTNPDPKPSKPTTRSSSIRQSLTLASVGKAIIAGVRSKESPPEETKPTKVPKVSKKTKETRRQSSTPTPSAQPVTRISSSGDRPKRESTPEARGITRKRLSTQHSRSSTDDMKSPDATPQAPAATGPTTRGSLLRPKTAPSGSALPKLRPRATATETAKPPSPRPSKVGSRRRLSSSSDSEEGGKEQRKPQPSPSLVEKEGRPISPLPQRVALKSSSAVNSTPPATPSSKLKPPSPPLHRNGSPTRPTKLMKTSTNSSASKALPQPPSSASSQSNSGPQTPKASAVKSAATRSVQDRTRTGTTGTPMGSSPMTPSRDSPSPLARRARMNQSQSSTASASTAGSSSFSSSQTETMKQISEDDSEDTDEEDVALLLAPTSNLVSATPAMPRIQRAKKRTSGPATPTRDRSGTIRGNATLLQAPSSSASQRHTRSQGNQTAHPAQQVQASTSNSDAHNPFRMSILSWEHASLSASQQLGPGEAEKMLCDVDAPFSGPTSPTASIYIDIPPSPCLSAIDSPSLGFGSISQVLLPDVTPSPAVNLSTASRFNVSPEAATDASATYLRLQLAAAEDLSNDRMQRMMAMEEEIHNLKQAHAQQMEEMTKQMMYMEKQSQQAAYAASLEEQLRNAKANAEAAVRETAARLDEAARASQAQALKSQRKRLDAVYASVLAGTAWNTVKESCKAELEAIHGDREVLAVLLSELQQLTATL